MTERLNLRLQKGGGQPWGFRLQGGADFTTPLSVQSVAPGGVAAQCGLAAGDAVLQINSTPSDELEHEAAKQEIVHSGDTVDLIVERGAVTVWRPKVTPLSDLRPEERQQIQSQQGPYDMTQKTSLAANKQEIQKIGSTHNRSARPFGGASATHAPAEDDRVPAVVHAQFNSPIGMYSNNNLVDTYSAQSKVLMADIDKLDLNSSETVDQQEPRVPEAGHAPEAVDSGSNSVTNNSKMAATSHLSAPEPSAAHRSVSPTMLAIQEMEGDKGKKGRPNQSAVFMDRADDEEIRYQGYSDPNKQSRTFRLLETGLSGDSPAQPSAASPRSGGTRSVQAPVTKPLSEYEQKVPAGSMNCQICGMMCIGVLIKVRGKPMHPECFKCARCSMSLKNQGYFAVEEKLYCEKCARFVSKPPEPNMQATTVYR